MKKIFLILFLLTVIFHQRSLAQSSEFKVQSSDCEILLSKSYLKSYWNSGLTVLGQPLHYDWKDWTVFGGVAAVSALSFVYDDEIFAYIDRTFSDSWSQDVSRYTDVCGEEWFIMSGLATTYIVSAINKDCRLRSFSLAAIQSFVFAEAVSAGIKVLSCRTRPNEYVGSNWEGPFASFESTSFASGHAMRAFALATTLSGFYKDKTWVGVLSYSLATLSSVGRVVSKEHWVSDVVVGAAVGYFIGRGVVLFNEKIGNISNVDIQPVATDSGIGIAIKF